ncbi:RHS repeat-associated core domain-containing protein [uncultured Roseobacter sp.]|uniref:RHS repeat-associated core domain-containing protein n=1 Tax=uncultured Roseobacter sp. TaxID=114847 RepID=UPI002628E5B1|nr:RHS repeat-associated core domain-containing protein [uncultured Roseobacter sp.]
MEDFWNGLGLGDFAFEDLDLNLIEGTQSDNRINGTNEDDAIVGFEGRDLIRGGFGNDVIATGAGRVDYSYGGDGADIFAFGLETENGFREIDYLRDFDVAEDRIALGSAEVVRSYETRNAVKLVLSGDQDVIVVYGANSFEEIGFVEPQKNTAPTAEDDTGFEVTLNEELRIATSDLLQNDTDLDGDSLSVVAVSNVQNGTVALDDQGTEDTSDDEVVVLADGSADAPVTFDYLVSDGDAEDSASVIVDVQTPQFEALQATPGTPLVVDLNAFFPELESPTFMLSVQEDLPSGRISSDGILRFEPSPEDVGTILFTVTASSGGVSEVQQFQLDVEADPDTRTRVSGIIQNTEGEPLEGITVQLDEDEAVTDEDGRFTIILRDQLDNDALRVLAGEVEGSTYPSVAEPLPLLLSEFFDGVNNVIDRPIFLPELDIEGGVQIDPDNDTVVTNADLPGAEVLVRAGNITGMNGEPFEGVMTITEVPRDLTPATLPPNFLPDLVVTIQPGEMQFGQPAPLTLPNTCNLAPGTILDLWSINPETGEFDDVGDGRVSADGRFIETINGGVETSSWHFFVPPEPTPNDPMEDDKNPPDDGCKSDCGCVPGTSRVELHSGAVVEEHALVTYQSEGETRGLTFVYDSARANPNQILHFGYDNTQGGETTRLVADLVIKDGDFEMQVPGAPAGFGLDAGAHFWKIPEDGGDIEAAIFAPMEGLSTGRYDYELTSGLLCFTGVSFAGTTVTQDGSFNIVNAVDSPYGAGWGIAGLQEVVENRDGSVLIVDGNGSELLFELNDDGSYRSPVGDFSTLTRAEDGTFSRTMTDEMVYQFNAENLLETVTDRNDQVSTYAYDDEGRLVSMTDEAGLQTTLSYENGYLTSVEDPAGRVTSFAVNEAGNLTEIADPDSSSRTWGYDSDHLMTSEVDKRGNTETTTYDFAGRAESAVLKDGATLEYDPIQVQGLFDPSLTTNPDDAPVANSATDTLISVYKDANGDEITYIIDGEGQIVSSSDAEGALPEVGRNSDNLVSSLIDGNGQTTQYSYDDLGNVVSIADEISSVLAFGELGGGVLIVNGQNATSEFNTTVEATSNLQEVFGDAGAAVTVVNSLAEAGNIDGFSQIWDIRFSDNQALTDLDDSAYEDYLQQGGSLFLLGENSSFPTRNASIIDFFEDLGAGDLGFVGSNSTQTVNEPFNGPNEISTVTYRAPGGLDSSGTGVYVTSSGSSGSAVAFGRGDLSGAAAGSAVALFDVNLLQDAREGTSERNLLSNISLGGVEDTAKFFTYDSIFNQLTSYTNELGRQTLYEVDIENGNTLSIVEVIGEVGGGDDLVTSFTYTVDGLIDTMTDPLGRVTDYDYSATGLVSRITFAVGREDEAFQSFAYDLAGNLTTFVDENSNITAYEYDAMNRLLAITEADPDGDGPLVSPKTEFVYDAAGNLSQVTDAEGNNTANVYDALDRLTKTTDANGGETSFGYDNLGNLLEVTDPNGNKTLNEYDERDRLIKTIDARGGETVFTYDQNNNLTSLTDSVGNKTSFEYDARDRLVREIDPLGEETTYSYDIVDNLASMTDRNGREITYVHDDVDRLVSEDWVGDAQEFVYSYDKASNLTQVSDLFSTLSFSYDARDRVTQASNVGTPNTPQVILNYSYDDAGNRTQMSELIEGGIGASTDYTYDALNRLAQITQGGLGVAEKRVDFGYNTLGQFTSIDRFADLAGTKFVTGTTYAYDALNRVTDIDHSNRSDTFDFYDFVYDAGSRITAITDRDGTSDYSYDATDQLTGAQHSNPELINEAYEYDLNGNRITTQTQGTDYVTGAGNRLLEDSRYTFAYDAEGNMISRVDKATGETRTFTWDYRNRLVEVLDEAADGTDLMRAKYTYDPLDRRVAKMVDLTPSDGVEGETTHFVYDGDDVVLEFSEALGSEPELVRRNLHGPAVDQILAIESVSQAETRWIHTDHLGTVKVITDDAGAVVNEITYDSYGNIEVQTNEGEAVRYAFTGREFDDETEQLFYRARYYDAEIGRFTGEDPIKFAGGINLYEYVYNEPIGFVDPYGLCPCGSKNDLIKNARTEARDFSKSADRSDINSGFGPGTYKCNLFADEQLEKSGFELPNIGGGTLAQLFGKNPPGARSLSDPNYTVPGWPVSNGPPGPGDLIATEGHVGIVTAPGKTISATPKGVKENDWGFRPGQNPVIRRCLCP